ncbi:MAG: hypothetical protein VKM34_10905 [Cyanobacteriota bacterium]|nr:hypothetical protein [Cyanobacteriota bacterium]
MRWQPLLLLLAALLPGAGSSQTLKGEVLSIGDGDTLRVRQGGRAITVRLACIDAPEIAQSPWGQQARRHLQQRLPIGREVSLEVKSTESSSAPTSAATGDHDDAARASSRSRQERDASSDSRVLTPRAAYPGRDHSREG